MEWSSEGLIIGVRRHGESALILEAMVPGHGRCLGLVRGGRSPKHAAFLQAGNSAQLTWRARLEDHLGTFTAEATRLRAAEILSDRQKLYLLQLLADHLRLLPERDPHDELLRGVISLIDEDRHPLDLAAELARFEMYLLEELGFGLDIETCAVTGVHENLTHVSPKTGRAVSAEAAAPYVDRLFVLPAFLTGAGDPTPKDIAAAFALTGYFLDRHVWAARQIRQPETREWLVRNLTAG
ncbi:DNA repair protein RecO [Pelagibacterium flavum]|uniref:DNA repair protein RecO n=1 Tax=Pelagibacterium flavum TaxID=2984530 RepID=A0ABY6IK82_9HYPH|nr:DNA repair protein RecO [Pelagibacterium sp. YIM 151497]MAN77034.1 DNA repair protein RecO [Hyphomicrobiales bacterium]UYQ70769.1 DNA repair protein RecO [Pelagibacterium sp. YIM 151497]